VSDPQRGVLGLQVMRVCGGGGGMSYDRGRVLRMSTHGDWCNVEYDIGIV